MDSAVHDTDSHPTKPRDINLHSKDDNKFSSVYTYIVLLAVLRALWGWWNFSIRLAIWQRIRCHIV